MILAIQAAPLLLLLGLLLSGRAGPATACAAALAVALAAAALSVPQGLVAFIAAEAPRALFLALQPVAVMGGGLLFHAAVSSPATATAPVPATPRRIYAATLLGGAFMECVTGFGVGAVMAVGSLRRMGLAGGAPVGAMAILSLWVVPWGGLGPGSAMGAAMVGVPARDLAIATAAPHAIWLLALLPIFWRLSAAAGVAVPGRERLAQWLIHVVVAGLLLAANRLLPWEIAGIVATGLPLLWALHRQDPPRGAAGWRRAGTALAPWLLLIAALLGARSWHGAPAWTPFAELPGVPVNHVAVILWTVSLILLAARGNLRARAAGALARGWRPARAMLLYVLLGRVMAASGAAAALAGAAAGALGAWAALAIPPLGLAAGMVTGSNVGSNAALMPVQAALGVQAGLSPALAAGAHNSAGAGGAAMSFGCAALVCGLLADGTRPAALWRWLWPAMAALVAAGWIALWLGRTA